jgi:signal transduction histidine kinase
MIRRWVRWWTEWVSGNPGNPGSTDNPASTAPGRIQTRYRNLAAAVNRHPALADTALAAALAACAVPQLVWWTRKGPGPLSEHVIFTVLLVAPLIWRRRFPLATFAFAALVALVQWSVNLQLIVDLGLLIYLYTVVRRYPPRVGVLAAAVVEAGTVLAIARWQPTRQWVADFILLSGLVMASFLLGITVRHWQNSRIALTQRATAAERTRIAREMHDVVAHSLSVMVTMSDGAALKQAAEPERAGQAMRQVSATGRQALDEMRRLLGVLRTEDAPDDRQPQPGMAQIDALIDQVRATGLTAELTVTGTPAAMPPGAELTVYRIVQEALTNTLKHAVSPTRVSVTIAHQPSSVTVDVRDDGARRHVRPSPEAATAGHGLTGMRERAAVYGGQVSAGPAPAGGWRIHADLPLAAVSRSAVNGSAE